MNVHTSWDPSRFKPKRFYFGVYPTFRDDPLTFPPLGYLTGSEDYFSHVRCQPLPSKLSRCALDLRDGEEVATGYEGQYSTELLTEKVVKLISNQDPRKVKPPHRVCVQYVEGQSTP